MPAWTAVLIGIILWTSLYGFSTDFDHPTDFFATERDNHAPRSDVFLTLHHPGRLRQCAAGAGAGWSILPFLIALPVFLYGLFLLRHLQRDYGDWSDAAPSTILPKGSA